MRDHPQEKEKQKAKQLSEEALQIADKSLYSQSYGFSSSHVQMGELDHKEGRAPKN